MNRLLDAFENRFLRGLRAGAGLFLVLTLLAVAGCSTDGAGEEAAEAEYPNINDVPEKPEAAVSLSEAEDIGEGLRADRENARYTDENLRADTSVQPPPAKSAAPEVREEKVTETVPETAEETVTEKAPEETPEVAAAAQEPVNEEPLPAPEVTEAKDPTPPPAPNREALISGETAKGPEVESVFQKQLAASGATRLPDRTEADSTTVVTESEASAPSGGTDTRSSGVTLTPPPTDGGRTVRNYAASDGSSPIETIYFAQGSHRINASDREVLDRIVRAQLAAGGMLKVVGHASRRTREMGETQHMIVNLNVSQARATAVAEYLLKAGVSPADLTVQSVSDAQPLIDEPMPSAEAKNRRVEIFLLN